MNVSLESFWKGSLERALSIPGNGWNLKILLASVLLSLTILSLLMILGLFYLSASFLKQNERGPSLMDYTLPSYDTSLIYPLSQFKSVRIFTRTMERLSGNLMNSIVVPLGTG